MEKLLECLRGLLDLEFVFETDESVFDDHDPTKDVLSDSDQITLPSEHGAVLTELARRGDVKGLREEADKLAQSDARYVAFAKTIQSLAEQFKVNKIRTILKTMRHRP